MSAVPGPILVAALSGRALASAAARAGEAVIVADLFGDGDTRALAPWVRLPGTLEDGIDGAALLGLALPRPVAGIVCGAGFEGDPALLEALSRGAPLIGNPPAVVARVKDPFALSALLVGLGLPHPPVARRPGNGAWLSKRRGGSGGSHIREAAPGRDAAERYWQCRAAGRPVSALFAANGRDARLLGLSEQWAAPAPGVPFRYGGCAAPAEVAPSLAKRIAAACAAIAAAVGLVGLNSLDMLVEGADFTILEINPRPGATLDVLDTADGRLWRAHRRAVLGKLPEEPPMPALPARAAAILYADGSRRVPDGLDWPAWVADRPLGPTRIVTGAPICTVLAEGIDAREAAAVARERAAALLARLPIIEDAA